MPGAVFQKVNLTVHVSWTDRQRLEKPNYSGDSLIIQHQFMEQPELEENSEVTVTGLPWWSSG